MNVDGATRLGVVVVRLRDGRAFDLTGMAPADGIAALRRAGVTSADIEATVHGGPRPSTPTPPEGAPCPPR